MENTAVNKTDEKAEGPGVKPSILKTIVRKVLTIIRVILAVLLQILLFLLFLILLFMRRPFLAFLDFLAFGSALSLFTIGFGLLAGGTLPYKIVVIIVFIIVFCSSLCGRWFYDTLILSLAPSEYKLTLFK